MSLDIYLIEPVQLPSEREIAVYIRDNGEIRRLTEEEWQAKFPEYEPIFIFDLDAGCKTVFEQNITHNLSGMAAEAGLYNALWHPERLNAEFAEDLIPYLQAGVKTMMNNNRRLIEFHSPKNGWGSFELLFDVAREYLRACRKYPAAMIRVSR